MSAFPSSAPAPGAELASPSSAPCPPQGSLEAPLPQLPRPDWSRLDEVAAAAREGQQRLVTLLEAQATSGLLVAFSGGVDSSYLLYEAHRALGSRCMAAIAVSESLANDELERARTLAASMGVRLHEVATHELSDPRYRRNLADRCYFCKKALFTELEPLAEQLGLGGVAYGAMADDVGDHRPGARAASEHRVRAPLQEAGLGKEAIRWLSREAGLPTWDLPAQACLASRLAYGQPVEPRWLRAIEEGEALLRSLGFWNVRVRHSDRTARIEVQADQLAALAAPEVRERVVRELKRLGYLYVTLDLEGFRSGSGNLVLSEASRSPARPTPESEGR